MPVVVDEEHSRVGEGFTKALTDLRSRPNLSLRFDSDDLDEEDLAAVEWANAQAASLMQEKLDDEALAWADMHAEAVQVLSSPTRPGPL